MNLPAHPRSIPAIASALAILGSLAVPTAASAESAWRLRGFAGWLAPSTTTVTNDRGSIGVRGEADGGPALGLGLERRLGARVGIEVAALYSAPDLTVDLSLPGLGRFEAGDELASWTLSASLPLHLTPRGKVDLFVAPLVAWVLYEDLDLRFPELSDSARAAFDLEDDVAWGAQIGVEAPVGRRAAFHARALYLDTTAAGPNREAPDDRFELDLDPWSVLVGVSLGL